MAVTDLLCTNAMPLITGPCYCSNSMAANRFPTFWFRALVNPAGRIQQTHRKLKWHSTLDLC